MVFGADLSAGNRERQSPVEYLVLLYQNPALFPTDPAARQSQFAAYDAFTQDVRAKGQFVSGTPLVPMPDQIRTVKASGVTSGPSHARPEALVGMYVLQGKDIDEIATIAAKIPAAKSGSVEIVPFMEM